MTQHFQCPAAQNLAEALANAFDLKQDTDLILSTRDGQSIEAHQVFILFLDVFLNWYLKCHFQAYALLDAHVKKCSLAAKDSKAML